jgi:type IV pilus assembly protein PilW
MNAEMLFFARQPQSGVRQRGVTLVELLVSLVLGLAVLVGLSSVYVAAKQAFRFQESTGRLQEDASYALEVISKDLRMAGFAGCRGIDLLDVSGVNTYYPTMSLTPAPTGITGPNPLAAIEPTNAQVTLQPMTPYNFIRGFDSVPSAMFAAGGAPVTSGTDSLFFVAGSSNAVSVTTAMAAPNSALTIAADAFNWGTANTYHFVVSDCISSSLFAGRLAAGGTQIDHSAVMGNNSDNFASSYQYGVDAIVMPLEWNFYYVATRSGAATPSLYRVFYDGNNRGTAQEVVSNVESLKLHYGENLNGINSATNAACVLATGGATCVPSLQADVWRTTAASVTDWSRVVAVRVGLMLVGNDNATNADLVSASPTLLGNSYTLPTGASTTRLRKEFSTTVVLRNRVSPR